MGIRAMECIREDMLVVLRILMWFIPSCILSMFEFKTYTLCMNNRKW